MRLSNTPMKIKKSRIKSLFMLPELSALSLGELLRFPFVFRSQRKKRERKKDREYLPRFIVSEARPVGWSCISQREGTQMLRL